MKILLIILGLFYVGCALSDAVLGLPTVPVPKGNPQTPEKIALGRLLFADQRLSADGTVSCASCHNPEQAFQDGLPVSLGVGGQHGLRNAPTIINSAFNESLFLDGRAESLETQALGPLLNPVEHGLKNQQAIVDNVCKDGQYPGMFTQAFGIQPTAIRLEHIVKAIASYERTVVSGNSPFDRYLFGRDHSALSDAAVRGMAVFKRKGNCMTCHEISWNHALFTDHRFYNIGIGSQRLASVVDDLAAAVKQGKNPDDIPLTEAQRAELGRFNISKNLEDLGRFKTPALRNIALTAPYMHDGSIKTLAEVIEYYDKGGTKNPNLDKKIFPLHLTAEEKADLLEFLQALTGTTVN